MAGITGDIKGLFNFKYKTRNDGFTDQYNRMFMVKAMLVGAFLTGMTWYNDNVNCILPGHFVSSSMGGYGPKSCWINGFYVYEELRQQEEWTGYFGLPINLGDDGYKINSKNKLETCDTQIKRIGSSTNKPKENDCKKMEKKFFLQYQWFPFYLAILAFLYYIPYICFKFVNTDLISLKDTIRSQTPAIDDIVTNYFSSNNQKGLNLRVLLNVLIKLLYLIVNIIVFVCTNDVLNGEFKSYGTKWNQWSEKNNSQAYNYMGLRNIQKPGEMILPVFGFCDILELGKDIKNELFNEYRLVCELSQHVLYHYVLIALWWLIIIGIVCSVIGLLECLVRHATRSMLFAKEEKAARRVFGTLSIRESEYLEFVYKKNVVFYGELIRKLHAERFDHSDSSTSGGSAKEAHM